RRLLRRRSRGEAAGGGGGRPRGVQEGEVSTWPSEIGRLAARVEELEGRLGRAPVPVALPAHPRGLRGRLRGLLERVAAEYGIEAADILREDRSPVVRIARHVAMYLARELTPLSYLHLGRIFQRDHATVIHGRGRIAALLPRDPDLAAVVARLRAQLE